MELDLTGPHGDVERFGVEVQDVTTYGPLEDFEDRLLRHLYSFLGGFCSLEILCSCLLRFASFFAGRRGFRRDSGWDAAGQTIRIDGL